MFGYVTANYDGLSADAQTRYKAYYCGLCRCLGEEYGVFSRLTLTYDMTFMTLFLSSIIPPCDERGGEGKCFIHPIKQRPYIINDNTYYAADVNIILSYYCLLDKWQDDKNIMSAGEAMVLRSSLKKAQNKQPLVCENIKKHLNALSEVEKASVLNPDVPADIFGELLGDVFVKGDRVSCPKVFEFGKSLGRFVYLADAVCDLKRDIKKEQYNPLVTTPKDNFEAVVRLLLSDCAEKYAAVREEYGCADGLESEIIENVLYSGAWTAIIPVLKRGKKEGVTE